MQRVQHNDICAYQVINWKFKVLHHGLAYRYGISTSQMTTNMILLL